jgi:hypothetical protein
MSADNLLGGGKVKVKMFKGREEVEMAMSLHTVGMVV